MKNRMIHISNLAQFIGFVTSIQEGLREKPFQLSSLALSNIADGFDRYVRQMEALKTDLIEDVTNDQVRDN